jgi:hypothetical protein
MGIWRGIAYAIDPAMGKEADKRQAEYDQAMGNGQYGGEGIITGLIRGWRATRWGNQYQQDNRLIQQANNPHSNPQHRPGCTCRFCFRGFINNGFGNGTP